jgi:molybdopterin synthase catalytic subunit
VTVQLFASYAESFGDSRIEIPVFPGGTVRDLLIELRALPGADVLPAAPLVAVNRRLAAPDQLVDPGDEVALFPPVAGG